MPVETTFQLTYDSNGGSGSVLADTATERKDAHDFTVKSGDILEREGFKFMGWAETADGDVKYNAGDTITVYNDEPTKTLYAK